MPYEMVITNANDLTETVVGFGEQKDVAERVFNWTWRGLVSDGYVSLHSAAHPNFIEIMPRRGSTAMTLELCHRQQWDLANVLRVIHILALDATSPKYFATGVMQAQTVLAEKAWKEAQYELHVTGPTGQKIRYPLPKERADAIKEFHGKVRERENSGWRVQRCPDALLKWMALDANGAVTLEFVEVTK